MTIALDIQTMMLISIFILFLMASLLLLASLHLKGDPCLMWVSIGLYMAGLGILSNILIVLSIWQFQVIWLGNILLITAHACLWSAIRIFTGKKVIWLLFFAGAGIWAILYFWQPFMDNPSMRIIIFTIFCVAYFGAAFIELITNYGKNTEIVIPMSVILIIYISVSIYRATFWDYPYQHWTLRPDSSLALLALIMMSIGVSFTTLILVRGREEDTYRRASLYDELTNLLNRRALFSQAAHILNSAQARNQNIALLMLDLDLFKRINDEQGHAAGDSVLRDFAKTLQNSIRQQDLCARFGGEEFVVLLTNVDTKRAKELSTRINKNLSVSNQKSNLPITTSIGIAMSQDVGYVLDNLLKAADEALYKAKADGRNCVRLWPLNTYD